MSKTKQAPPTGMIIHECFESVVFVLLCQSNWLSMFARKSAIISWEGKRIILFLCKKGRTLSRQNLNSAVPYTLSDIWNGEEYIYGVDEILGQPITHMLLRKYIKLLKNKFITILLTIVTASKLIF